MPINTKDKVTAGNQRSHSLDSDFVFCKLSIVKERNILEADLFKGLRLIPKTPENNHFSNCLRLLAFNLSLDFDSYKRNSPRNINFIKVYEQIDSFCWRETK